MPEPTKPKTALITGGAGGIGSAAARKLLERNYSVVIAGRNADALGRAAKELGSANVLSVPTDVADPKQCTHLVERAKTFTGRIDVLINAAGYAPMLPNTEITPDQWRQIIDINLSSVFFMTQAVWPVFGAQYEQSRTTGGLGAGGVIVNISSVAARNPFGGLGAYAAAKAGVNMLTLSAAREGKDIGVRVVGIGFGAVETKMLRDLPIASKIPAADILSPADAADAILSAIDGGMAYASGETVYIHRGVR